MTSCGIYWQVYFNSTVIEKVTEFAKNLSVETDEMSRIIISLKGGEGVAPPHRPSPIFLGCRLLRAIAA